MILVTIPFMTKIMPLIHCREENRQYTSCTISVLLSLWGFMSLLYAIGHKNIDSSCKPCRFTPEGTSKRPFHYFPACTVGVLLFYCLIMFGCYIACLFESQHNFIQISLRGTATQTEIEYVLCTISELSTLILKNDKHPEANCLRNSEVALKFSGPSSS